jgi:hypothetical protein
MLRKANNVFSIILDDNAQGALGFAAGTLVTDANLPKGAIALADLGNRFLTAAAFSALVAGDQYRILQGKGVGNPLMKSPVLTVGKTKMTINKHKPTIQQVTAVGYNGTSGSLPVANNTSFFIKVRKRDNDSANRSQPMSLFAGAVKTDATATQAELASLLARVGTRNFNLEPANGYLKLEVITDAASAAITGTTTLFTVINGAKMITVDGTLTNVAVGDYLRLGGTTTSTAVYKVIAISGSTLTVDVPYQGVSGTIAVASVQRILASAIGAANFGVVLTGKPAPFNVNTFRRYYANRFSVTFSDTTTPVTTLTAPQTGNGIYQQVAMDEYMSYGFEGQNNQLAIPSTPRDQEVKIPGTTAGATALTSKYSTLAITWEESVNSLVATGNGKGSVVIYLNLLNNAGLGTLSGGTSSGKELVTNLGLTAANFNE